MSLFTSQRLQLIQWMSALPSGQFEELLYALSPPPGIISPASAQQSLRAGELLTWAEGPLGPEIPAVLELVRNLLAIIAPEKLVAFDTAFSSAQQLTSDDAVVCPYQGLEPFTPETRQFFYGRQATVDLLQKKLEVFNFVPVIGPSGSGKSSVARAGLIPSLGNNWQVLEPIKPRVNPMAALELALSSLFQRASDIKKVQRLLHQQGLRPILEMLTAATASPIGQTPARTLLVIDQFEEVFTLCASAAEQARFIDCITAVQTLEHSPLAIVTTMRADFVEQWLDYGKLVQTIQNQAVWLGRLQGDDLIQAIEQPAQDLGYRLGPGLLEMMVQDVKEEKNCLPLLEFALTELWNQRDHQQKVLPLAAYTQMQGLKGALNKRSEDVYNNDLATEEERSWAKRICLELVRVGSDVRDTRRPQPREQLLALAKTEDDREVMQEVIEALVAGRLLVTTKGDEVDLAHEALMVGWQRFAKWRQEDRELRRLIQRVTDSEKEWNSKSQDDRYLIQGGLLAEVRERWPEFQLQIKKTTQAFFQRSDKQEAEQTAALEQAVAETKLREQIQKISHAYSRFIPREFLRLLSKDSIIEVRPGDQAKHEMSVLFADVRSFTAYSKDMTSEETFQFLNTYFSYVEPAMSTNNGFIFSYIGDALMALFDGSGSADNVLQAGIALLRNLNQFNQELIGRGQNTISVGVGIDTGSVVLGAIGGENRMGSSFTGDTLNLASRLEGSTKFHNASLLISQHTFSKLTQPVIYAIRMIDQVEVKYQEYCVAVYEVFELDAPDQKAGKLKSKSQFEEALKLYHQQVYSDALKKFQHCLEICPSDKAAYNYLQLCQSHA